MSSSIRKLEDALAEYYGWAITPESRIVLSEAVISKAERLHIGHDEYCEIAATMQSEMLALVEEAAVGETSFFREPDQFQFLTEDLFAQIAASHSETDTIRVWRAACSTGEEPYSIGIALNESAVRTTELRVEIFATDVRKRALLVASQAKYPSQSLSEVRPDLKQNYFLQASEEQISISPEVRRLVTFRRVNLVEQIFWRALAGRFDLIVCTNLLHFMHTVAIRRLVGRLAHSLTPRGYLMVAPSEANLVTHPQLREINGARAFFTRS